MRKLPGVHTPSKANASAFDRAMERVVDAVRRLFDSLNTFAPWRDRDVEHAKAVVLSAKRFHAESAYRRAKFRTFSSMSLISGGICQNISSLQGHFEATFGRHERGA